MSNSGIRSYLPALALCLFVFAFYQFLIQSSPIVYWDDAHIRWALREQVFLGRWLPLYQVFVVLSSKITPSLYLLKTSASILAIGSLVSAYALARRIFSEPASPIVIVFLALNMMFAALAIVPYSEVLFVGLTFLTLNFLDGPPFTRRFYLGLATLNLASLTSYAGWLLSAIIIVDISLRAIRESEWISAVWQTLKITLLGSLAPMAWLVFGVSGPGNIFDRMWSIFEFIVAPVAPTLSGHILSRLDPVYIREFSGQFFRLLTQQIGVEFLILGVVGFSFALSDKAHRMTHIRIAAFLILVLSAIAFLQPWKYGSLRQPFLLQVFILPYSAYGLVQGISWLWQKLALKPEGLKVGITILVAVLLSIRSIAFTTRFVTGNLRDPNRLIPFEIGSWLDLRLKADDAILVLDDTDYYPYALAAYMEYPLERVLDDRFDARFVQESLQAAQMVYVIGLYTSRDDLSSTEIRILEDLESSRIQAEQFDFGAVNLWYVPAEEVVYSP